VSNTIARPCSVPLKAGHRGLITSVLFVVLCRRMFQYSIFLEQWSRWVQNYRWYIHQS